MGKISKETEEFIEDRSPEAQIMRKLVICQTESMIGSSTNDIGKEPEGPVG